MATEKLNIVIDTVYRGRTDAKRAEDDIKDVGRAAKDAGEKSLSFAEKLGAVGAALGAAAIAAGVAFDAFKRGAELNLARDRFDALAGSIGAASDALMIDLRAATGGMVSDADLIAGATELMNTGIAGSSEEVIRFSNVIGRLGVDMSQLTLTIVNQSKMRLDSLGLSVADVTEKYEILRQTLPDEEAWKLAVLESLEEKALLFGDASETAAGDVAKLEAAWANLTSKMQQDFASIVAPVVEALAEIATSEGIEGQFIDANELARTTDTFEEYVDALRQANIHFPDVATAEAWFEAQRPAKLAELARIYRMDYTGAIADSTEALYEASDAAEERTGYAEDEAYAIRQVYAEMEEDRRIRERHAEILDLQRERSLRLRDAMDRADAATGDLFSSQIEFVENADPLAVELYNQADAAGASAEELTLLGVATGLFTEEQAEAALKAAALRTKIQELGEKIAEGMGIDEALVELQLFQDALNNATGDRTVTIRVNVDDAGGMLVGNGSGPQLSENATGTPSWSGGPTMVGEFGPEVVNLPQGSRITSTNVTHNDNRRMTLTNSRGVQRVVSSYLRNRSRRSRAV